MERTYLDNGHICLRAAEPEDLDIMYQIENNPQLWEVSCITVPFSRFTLKQYIESSQNDIFADRQLRLMIVTKEDRTVIGVVDISDFDPLNNRAAVGIVVLREHRQSGVAGQALKLLCNYCFNFLHLRQLYAYIPCDNDPSFTLFTHNGFVQSGVLKDWLQTEDGYKDVFLVQNIGRQ